MVSGREDLKNIKQNELMNSETGESGSSDSENKQSRRQFTPHSHLWLCNPRNKLRGKYFEIAALRSQ